MVSVIKSDLKLVVEGAFFFCLRKGSYDYLYWLSNEHFFMSLILRTIKSLIFITIIRDLRVGLRFQVMLEIWNIIYPSGMKADPSTLKLQEMALTANCPYLTFRMGTHW